MKRGKLILILISLFIILIIFKQYEISFKNIKGEASYGTYSVSLTIVDLVNYNITYSEFGGATTNFNILNTSQQQNISSLTLENTNRGKIIFIDNINISSNISLDYAVNFSFNRIELNSSNLTNFNKSATLYLYNLTFSNPRVLMNGIVCPSNICTENSYLNNIFSFNVTHFTVYSAEETPSVETPGAVSAATGGGGGGTLGGPKIIHIPGKLFDLILTLSKEDWAVYAGKILNVDIEILNFKDEPTSFDINYSIEDSKGNIIVEKLDRQFVERRLNYLFKLQLPFDIPKGEYKLCAQIEMEGDIALSCNSFKVIEQVEESSIAKLKKDIYSIKGFIFGIIIFIIITELILFILYTKQKREMIKARINLKKPMLVFFILLIAAASLFLFNGLSDIAGRYLVNSTNTNDGLDLDVHLDNQEVAPGENLVVITKLINRGSKSINDILIEYNVLDKDNVKLSGVSETAAIQTSLSLVKNVYIPKDLEKGGYIIEVTASYKDKKIKSSNTFFVKKNLIIEEGEVFPEEVKKNVVINRIIITVVLILFIMFSYYSHLKFKQIQKSIKKISGEDLKRSGLIKKR